MLETIINKYPELDVRIYGSESFRESFPNHYKSWIQFNESRKVFHNSRINISTHVTTNGDMYINERVTQILGSQGLLLVDHVKGIEKVLEPNQECIIMDMRSIDLMADQIKNILDNYSEYEYIKEKGYQKALEKLTWDSWANTILSNI